MEAVDAHLGSMAAVLPGGQGLYADQGINDGQIVPHVGGDPRQVLPSWGDRRGLLWMLHVT